MMVKGVIPRNQEVEESLKGIPWRVLNERLKSYERVLEEITGSIEAKGGERLVVKVREYMESVMRDLSRYKVYSRE
jgi:phage-related protein